MAYEIEELLNLRHSIVRRAGVTSNTWYGPGEKDIKSYAASDGLIFDFNLDSKGGGRTHVRLTVDPKDLRAILKKLALENPGLAGVFADCTKISVARLLKGRPS